MEKKTRKKSPLVATLTIVIILFVIITVIFTLSTYFMNVARDNDKKRYTEEQQKQQEIQNQKDNNVILYKLDNNKNINQYGHITTSNNNSAILLQGITLKDNQEHVESSLFENLLKLYNTLVNNDLTDKVNKIDIADLENIKIYINSENKIIQLGNFENLSTKFVYAKNIMEKERGKSGTIFVNDIEKVLFRESL